MCLGDELAVAAKLRPRTIVFAHHNFPAKRRTTRRATGHTSPNRDELSISVSLAA